MSIKVLKLVRLLLILFGAAVLVNGIALLFFINYNAGIFLTILVGIALFLYGIFFAFLNKLLPKWLKIAILAVVVLAVLFVSFLHIKGNIDNVIYKEDVLIVLGASIDKDTPSVALKERLNVAVEYHKKNPEARIVVSGGQGPQETITEAAAMETYLISKGVPQDIIIKEETSTSTYENFSNSKAILDAAFEKPYSVAFVTNDYHIYRAESVAKLVGIESVTHIHSSTKWYMILQGTLRECLAVVKYWMFKN